MSWRDELNRVVLPDGRRLIGASFRGVPFFVESSDLAGGRRTVTHEFPLRDDPFVEDLGRRARVFQVEGYVVGDGYLQQKRALLAALEDAAGAGELVHPYHGARRAICTRYQVRERSTDGGMAIFSLELAEAPAQAVAPSEAPDLPAQVDESSDTAVEAVSGELAQNFSTDGAPGFSVESLSGYLAGASAAVKDALSGVTMTTQELARLSSAIQQISQQASSIVREPADTVEAFLGALRSLDENTRTASSGFLRALLSACDVSVTPDASPISDATATRRRERDNQVALGRGIRSLLVIEASRVIPNVFYTTHEDAVADRDEIVERLDAEAAEATDAAYPALMELRARVLRAVPGDRVLARLVTVERPVPIPSLLLSYQLYGSTEQESDIIARNKVRHPGIVAGSLRVLSNG